MTDYSSWESIKDHVNEVSEISAMNLMLLDEDEANDIREKFVYTGQFLQTLVNRMTNDGFDFVDGSVILEFLAAQTIALYKAAGVWDESLENGI